MPLPFNKSLDEQLIKFVRENPTLYDPKHPKYMDLDSREIAWQKIGNILNRPAVVCKARWLNIRDMMRRKVKERLRNPNQRSSRYKYEDELDFMINIFMEPVPGHPDAEYIEEESTSWLEMPAEVDDNLEYDTNRDVKPNVLSYKTEVTRDTQKENSCRFNEPNYQELNPTDPLDIFLLTIGTTLRSLTPYYLNQAKSKIFQLVQDYELKQIMNKDDQIPGSSDCNA